MIGAAQIAAMKPSAVLINIGRGPVVDEAALLQALESGKIRGAALDVFNGSRSLPGIPFYKLTNVLLSPHTADRVEGFLEPAVELFPRKSGAFPQRPAASERGGQTCRVLRPAIETGCFEDIRAASARIRPIAKRTPVMTSRGFNASSGDRSVLQVREPANRRRVQDSRRVQFYCAAFRRTTGARRGGVFERESRPGGRDRRASLG